LQIIEGLQNQQISLAWHIAAFQRQKKLKDVSTYFVKAKAEPQNLEAKMKGLFASHNDKVK
jgi:hypothetical protein